MTFQLNNIYIVRNSLLQTIFLIYVNHFYEKRSYLFLATSAHGVTMKAKK